MLITVTGGSGSGKSEFAENILAAPDGGGSSGRIYIATMEPFGEEGARRIRRHRAMRQNKGFETVERYRDLKGLKLPGEKGKRPSALLECISNLAANELYGEGRTDWEAAAKRAEEEIFAGIRKLLGETERLVVVTNEVFSDGVRYDASTEAYLRLLGQVNRRLAALSDVFVEIVCSIPLYHKGGPL